MKRKKFRSVFISDLHLGSKGCQADLLLSFLKSFKCDKLYLVGDIIDILALKRCIYWPDSHTEVIKEIITKSQNGTEVIYITGNHDKMLRKFVSYKVSFGKIRVLNSIQHIGVDGKKYLVIHGDQFDKIVSHKTGEFWTYIGNHAYTILLSINTVINKIGRFFGIRYWSLADCAKRNVKISLDFINQFEKEIIKHTRENNYDGVFCGHIHSALINDYGDILYLNDGDWVDCCTSIVENYDGTFEIR